MAAYEPTRYFKSMGVPQFFVPMGSTLSVVAVPPAPTPAASYGGGGGGGGGGSPNIHEQGMTRVAIGTYHEKLDTGIPEVSNELVQGGMIRALQKKIASLEAYIQNLEARHALGLSAVSGELAQALQLAEELRVKLQTAQAEGIRREVHAALMARFGPRLSGAPAEPAGPGILAGLAAVVAVEVLVPDRWPALKGVARLAAAGVACRAVSRWLQA